METFEIVATIRRDKESPLDTEHFPNMVCRLYKQGVKRFRINLAKFDADYFNTVIDDINEARKRVDGDVHFILDFPYPGKKSRINMNGKVLYEKGQCVKVFSAGVVDKLAEYEMEINTSLIGEKMRVKDRVWYGDGTVCFEVEEIVDESTVILRALNGGFIENAKALNFTGSLDYDESVFEHIVYMLKSTKCEYLALSFVENGLQLQEIKRRLGDLQYKIMSKVESRKGVENIEEICDYSDEIMLGRGDLGLYSDISEFGYLQDKVVSICQQKGKKVWLATDFLSSMEKRFFPSRAEVIDVYNAKKSGANGIIITYGVIRSDQCDKVIEIINKQKVLK